MPITMIFLVAVFIPLSLELFCEDIPNLHLCLMNCENRLMGLGFGGLLKFTLSLILDSQMHANPNP